MRTEMPSKVNRIGDFSMYVSFIVRTLDETREKGKKMSRQIQDRKWNLNGFMLISEKHKIKSVCVILFIETIKWCTF